jgi:hypothetical protein
VAAPLGRLVDGKPGLLLSPACKVLRKGFAGGYHYRRVKVTGDERYHDMPDKNAFSHPHDALQYALSGGGEVRALTGPRVASSVRPTMARTDFSVLGPRPVSAMPPPPWQGRPQEPERTPEGEEIIRSRYGSYMPP